VTDPQVVPGARIVGEQVGYHPECLDRGVKIPVAPVEHAD